MTAETAATDEESPLASYQSQIEPLRLQLTTLREQFAAVTDLDPEVRTRIEEELQTAEGSLANAETALSEAAADLQQATQVQSESSDLQQMLEELRTLEPPAPPQDATLAQLEQSVAELQQTLQELRTRQQQPDDPQARAARRKVLRESLISLPQNIASVSQQLPVPEGEPPLLTQTRQLAMQCRKLEYESRLAAVRAEIALYDAEDSYAVANYRRDWLRIQSGRTEAEIKVYEARISQLRQEQASERVLEARNALSPRDGSPPSQLVRSVIEGPLTVGEEQFKGSLQLALEEVDIRNERAGRVQVLQTVEQELQQVRTWLEQATKRVETTGPTQALGFRLRQQRERLPDLIQIRRRRTARLEDIEAAQNSFLDYSEQLDAWTETEPIVEQILSSPEGPRGEAARAALKSVVTEAVEQRRQFLTELVRAYTDYTDTLDALDVAESSLIDETEAFTEFMDERILWIRSHRPLSPESLRNDKITLLWLLDGAAFPEIGQAIASDFRGHWVLWSASLVLFVALLVRSSALRNRLRELARIARGRVTTVMKPTLEAWLVSAVLSLAWPGLILLFAWRLRVASDLTAVATLSVGLVHLGVAFLVLEFFRQVCRPSGLADVHFEWPDRAVILLQRTFRGLIAVALPAGAVVALLHAHESGLETDAFEMLAFVATMLILLLFMHRLLKPSTGVLREWVAYHPDGWGQRLQYPIYVLGMGLFALLLVLTAIGYYYTAQRLLQKTQFTLWLVLGLLFVRALLYRAITLHRRRLAMDQVRQRRAAAEERAAAEQAAVAGEESSSSVPEVSADAQPDLGHVSRQTQKLLNTTLIVIGLAALWAVWIDVLPALNYLKQWTVWDRTTTALVEREVPGSDVPEFVRETVVESVTYVDLAVAALLVMLTITAARNVPSLVEVSVLQRLPLDASARYATTAVTRYLIVLAGIMLVSRTIGIGWEQVQWLAAALTFGLAFGLQEIFANFVSGIIILFEQPVRVGDVVTIDTVSGVVSRIRMRSTTITDWDRKEYVVPNKEFITGRLLNWTLSDTTNRVVVNVGVAYGSDTNKVHETISRIAAEHPRVLTDPPPVVTFESFGDSSLNFVLRAYLASLEFRLLTISELHAAIHNELARAGIEIPFPQRDLHLKSWPAELDRALPRPEPEYQHDG